ncbi:hypothetical protein [Planctomicrobium sp. SH664]|uniref:hypothetical protein n=1 Tax=Planctomicrobium sp. SH664 TaxID=3448125 RepID=UPI003F5B66F4
MNTQTAISARKDRHQRPTARHPYSSAAKSTLVKPSAAGPSPLNFVVERLGHQELRRRLWHFAPGFGAIIATQIPRLNPVPLPEMVMAVLLAIVIPVYCAARCHGMIRRRSDEDSTPIIGYAIPITALCLLFRGHLELAFTTTAIIAFGDGSATFAGLLRQGDRIPWNPSKSWAGMNAFIVVGTIMGTLVYVLSAPSVPVATALLCVMPAVTLCAVVETLPLPVNDNISVSCTAALAMIGMQTLAVGW